jgi:hypothetical protein
MGFSCVPIFLPRLVALADPPVPDPTPADLGVEVPEAAMDPLGPATWPG